MKNRILSLLTVVMLLTSSLPMAFAEGLREGASSLLLPTTGQALNGEIGSKKTAVMAGVEVASITAITIIGFASGGAPLLFGVIPLAANHVWSATDAYKGAKNKNQAMIVNAAPDQGMLETQRNLDPSRQNRFEREQAYRSDIYEKVRRAGEENY